MNELENSVTHFFPLNTADISLEPGRLTSCLCLPECLREPQQTTTLCYANSWRAHQYNELASS